MAGAVVQKDYYAILGVGQTASAEDIGASYLRLLKQQQSDGLLGSSDSPVTSQLVRNNLILQGTSTLRAPANTACFPNYSAP